MKSWVLWMLVGLISLVGGIVALLNPLAATITAQQLVGWIAILTGVVQAVAIFRSQGGRSRLFAIFMTVLFLFLGWSILAHPLAAILSLTLLIALTFLTSGAFKAAFSFSLRGTAYFLPVLISGIASLVLGVMVLSNFPQSAVVMLGILLAIELISNGISMISISLFARNDPAESTGA